MEINTKTKEERIWEAVIRRLGDLGREEKDSDTLFVDLGADSMDVVEIVMNLEREFNVEISMEAGERMISVKTTIEVLEELDT